MKKRIEVIMGVVLLVAAGFLAKRGAIYVQQSKVGEEKTCIVIDAGHGGSDPGKIGINGKKEKDINLQIAKELKKKLEKEGIEVVMTRESDEGLYNSSSRNKKVDDMKKRCKIIDEAKPVFTISIHQNSYPEEYVKGAQVFYYGQSQEGKELAEILQESMVQQLDKENHRTAKANESYYLLKKTESPTVIVECGFLSNSEEAKLLADKDYQKKVAEAIHTGIKKYLKEEK
ncbi:MAG: N-acetylmuramoyl-L-alanine amidase CwlD [Lachnospiraceae bacterium]|nr:N-acetylmuramoyl-L-alanine amidase CwlD [Lachnospiraceae bacterium]MDD7378028.1 N-acetylmuramoyl-L-alanine amidase CwlD [Lachnospiraceae bacterium]MDY4617010.1 N-acetylmuramoyl-L-alanine amidase CwlD [Lachnospiraceae bacterium]